MIYGLDLLGGAKYVDLIRKHFPAGWALGVFSEAFGDARPVVSAVANSGKAPAIRIHLLWKDKKGGVPTYSARDFQAVIAQARKYRNIIRNATQVKWFISPCCEHGLKRVEVEQIYKMLSEEYNGLQWQFVNNPDPRYGAKKFPWAKEEYHGGEAAKNHIFSFDGESCVDKNVTEMKEKYVDSDLFFLWHARFNLKWNDHDKTPRPERTAAPDRRFLNSIIALKRDKKAVKLPKGWLYKSHAERHSEGDLKGDKALIISPLKAKEVEFIASNEEKVATLKCFGEFEGGGFRYYSSLMGVQIAERAFLVSGDCRVKVVLEKKEYGKIDPVYREGWFR